MNQSRALRYRKLALQEPDKEKAQLLQLLADEADRGVLCSVEWKRHSSKIEIPIKITLKWWQLALIIAIVILSFKAPDLVFRLLQIYFPSG